MEGEKGMGTKSRRPLKPTNKKKIRKKKRITINLRNVVPEIVGYLKSDSYFYSHFISSSEQTGLSAGPGDVFLSSRGEPVLGNMDQVKEKLLRYLKSDTFLYIPLEGTQHGDDFAVKTVISPPRGQELQFTRVSSTVLSSKISWQTKKVTENPVVEKQGDHGLKGLPHKANDISPHTPGVQEPKKHAVRRSTRVSTISG